jgi:peptide/nickel transport system substrate-binding protein
VHVHHHIRRRVASIGALALTGALVLAACGSSDDDDSAATTAAARDTAAATTAAAGSDGTTAAPTTAGDDEGAAQEGGTLTFALGNDPLSFNPQGGGGGNDTWYVQRQLFDSLVDQDPETGEIIPWLAESWEVDDTATSFTFHLRDDVTFSDGTPFTADVVKANFDDIIANGAKANAALPSFGGYESTTVVDPQTVTVAFSTPNAPFLQAASQVGLSFVAPSTLAVPFEERATSAIGTGPYTLESYTKDSEVVLAKRPGYAWGSEARENTGEAHLDQVVFKIIPEASVRTGALQSEQVDVIGGVPPQDIASIRDGGFTIVERANPGVVFGLSVIVDKAPLDDPALRSALALAIDATTVRDAALSDEFAVATSALAATTPSWVDLGDLITSDPDAAAAALDELGWTVGDDGVRAKDGERLSLSLGWITNFGPNQTALELIQAQLAAVGVEATLEGGPAPDYLQGLTDGTYDLAWGNLSRADGDVLRTNYGAATTRYGVDDPDLEALFATELSTSDQAARDEALAEAQRLLIERAYLIPVFELTSVLGTIEDVHGVELGADSRLTPLTDAWVAS